jgi:TonB family protein
VSLSHAGIIHRVVLVSLTTVLMLSSSPVCLHAQVPPEVATLANGAVEKIAKLHPQQILVAPLRGCLLDPQMCHELDTSLRSALESALPAIKIIGQADAVRFLKMHGVPAIDVYVVDALQIAGAEAGSELLVAEDLEWTKKANKVKVEIFDTLKQSKLSESQTSVVHRDPVSDEEPIIYKDPESGVSLIVSKKHESKPKYFPSCQSCPDPRYTDSAKAKRLEGVVVLLATVNEQGIAVQITVVKTFDSSMTQSALDAVRAWKFNPAVGPDGKPFAVRVPIEVTFRLTR